MKLREQLKKIAYPLFVRLVLMTEFLSGKRRLYCFKDGNLNLSKINRILISEIHNIGDVVFITPAIEAVRNRFPGAYIAAFVQDSTQAILQHNPNLDEIVTYESKGKHAGVLGLWKLTKNLRSKKFDLVLLFDRGEKSTIIASLAGIPLRFGYVGVNVSGIRSNYMLEPLLTYALRDTDEKRMHRVQGHLELLNVLGCDGTAPKPRLYLLESEQNDAVAATLCGSLKDAGFCFNRKLVMIHPGATWIDRQWPTERFAQLADALGKNPDIDIIIVGGPSDKASVQKLTSSMTLQPLLCTTELRIREFMALATQCDLFIGNDSGPLHIASAVGIPVVGLYGPNLPEIVGPAAQSSDNIVIYKQKECSPCMQNSVEVEARCPQRERCMDLIYVDEVMQAAKEFICGTKD